MTSTVRIVPNQLDSTGKPNILNLINFCKGFLMLWIVYFHFHKENGLGWQGVHAFIVFSGFGLSYSCLVKKEQGGDWKQWLLRRLQRVLPVYWVTCFLGFLSVFLLNFHKYDACSWLTCGLEPALNLFLEVSFLKVLSYQTMWSLKNLDHLWFIPLIVSFYVIFPVLFKFLVSKGNITKNCFRLFAVAVLTEFLYRFLSIYLLNGFPIGHENGLLMISALSPLDNLPQWFPFQLQMPFGLFPSRIGEFCLGMLAAAVFVQHHEKIHTIFLDWVVVGGLGIWATGIALVYVNRLGWVASDFLIALGSVIVCLNLAWLSQRYSPLMFSMLSTLGVWSYYIYLTHTLLRFIFFFVKSKAIAFLSNSASHSSLMLFTVDMLAMSIAGLAILLASWILMKFDQSKMPKWLMQNTFEKVLR